MSSLANFVSDIASGAIEVVDLTETLREDYPAITLPPEFGQRCTDSLDLWQGPAKQYRRYDPTEGLHRTSVRRGLQRRRGRK